MTAVRDTHGRFVSRAVLAEAVLEEAVTKARQVIGEATDVVIREHSGRVVRRYRDFDRGYVPATLTSATHVAELLDGGPR